MSLTGFFLRNRRFSLVAFLFMLALGFQAFRTIPVSEDPTLEIPRYDVVAVAPGMGPVDFEKLVVRPLEDAVRGLEGMKRVTSVIRDGVAQLSVEFQFGADTDKKYGDVLREVSAVRPRLPSTLARLEVLRGQTTNVAILQMALVSPGLSYAALQNLAEDLQRRLANVEGVKRANKYALPDKEVRVTLKLSELARLKIPLPRIVAALQASQSAVPGGSMVIGDQRMDVITSGAISDLEVLRGLPLGPAESGTGVVRLKDVADVSQPYDEETVFGRYNGVRAVFLTVMMQKDRNIHSVSDGVKQVVDDFRKELPSGCRLEIGLDQAGNVRHRMSGLEHDFELALLLVLVTLAPLGFRPALIVMITIPLCLALGLAALQWTGFSLNQLSIVGCVIALGLLVDDSIVVVENIARFRRDGYDPVEATRLATKQIMAAVLGTSTTMLLAFLPLLLLPEAAGLFIRSLPAAAAFAIIASLFVALTIVPWLASVLLTGREHPEGNAAMRLLRGAITRLYLPVLKKCMAHRGVTLLITAVFIAGSCSLVPLIGFSLFPKADTPQFLVEITADESSSTAATDGIARQVEDLLRQRHEVRSFFTTVGEGNPRVYYNVFQTGRQTGTAAILVALHAYDNERTPALIEELRVQASKIPQAHIEFKEFQNGPPLTAPIEVRVIGDDLQELSRLAMQVEALVKSTPGTREVFNPLRETRKDVSAKLDEDWLATQGLDRTVAQQMVRLAFAGLEAGKFREDNGEESTIRLCLPHERLASLADWSELLVPLVPGRLVPLHQIAKLEPSDAAALIERRNGEHMVTIRAQVQNGFNIEKVTTAVREKLRTTDMPAGYRWEFGGEAEGRLESFAGFGDAILLAVFGILAILVLEFKTFRGTVIVASVIPLGIIGGLVGLWLTGYSLSFMAVVGFIALIGIEIKNSILLVDFTNQLRVKGVSLEEAIAKAGEIRFLPVVLTTMTALGALIPLAWQRSGLFSPLAVVIIGGSLSSLLLSRLVTPVLYRILPPKINLSS